MENALKTLKATIRHIEAEGDKAAYETPWRGGERGQASIIFLPTTTEEVQEILKVCHTERWPVIPQGGNTGLVFGSTPPPQHAGKPPVIINLQYMKSLLGEVDPVTNTVVVQGGMVLEKFKQLMEERGYLFSIDMGSKGSAQLAGAASTNAGGTNFLRYGGMHEQVVGLKVVLPDGRLLNTISNVQKDNTGFSLTPLFIGAEGTLGIITELKLKLYPLPKQKATALVAVEDVAAAVHFLKVLKATHAEELTAFELMADAAYQLVVSKPGNSDPFAGQLQPGEVPYSHYVLVELSTSKEKTDQYDLEQSLLSEIEKGFEAGTIRNAVVEKPQILWAIRESISEAASHRGVVIPNDISVPIEIIPEFIEKIGHDIEKKWPELKLKPAYFGHLGDGNLHYNLIQFKGTAPQVTDLHKHEIEDYISQRVIEYNGSPVAEHGIGTKNIHAFRSYKDKVAQEIMKQVKQTLDPHNIMNPYVFWGEGS